MNNKLFKFIVFSFLLLICVPSFAGKWRAKHVVFIGLDGWGAYSVEKANIPNIKKMMDDGSYTLEKRSVLPSSSAVNWASMFMGAGPEIHGYTDWNSRTPDLPSRVISHYGVFPSIWGLFRDANPDVEIGYFYQWGGMGYVAEMKAMSKEMNVKAEDDASGNSNQAMATQSATYIKDKKPAMVGIFFDEPDNTGHKIGHDTKEYYDKMAELDGYIGEILNAVKEAGMWDDTIFILTADHGGINKGHGGKTMQEMQTPFIVSGKGIKKGFNFEESMMQFDVAATIAYIFKLEQPQVWIGRPMKQIFK